MNPNVTGEDTTNPTYAQGEVSVGAENYTTYLSASVAAGALTCVSVQYANMGGPGPVINWRFVLAGNPSAGRTLVDGDGISYEFEGYRFVGTPISQVDGRIYALALKRDPSNAGYYFARLMCFNPSVTINANLTGLDSTQATYIQQPDEFKYMGIAGGVTQMIQQYQYHINTGGGITFTNFSSTPPRTATMEANMSFPLPVQVSYGPAGQACA